MLEIAMLISLTWLVWAPPSVVPSVGPVASLASPRLRLPLLSPKSASDIAECIDVGRPAQAEHSLGWTCRSIESLVSGCQEIIYFGLTAAKKTSDTHLLGAVQLHAAAALGHAGSAARENRTQQAIRSQLTPPQDRPPAQAVNTEKHPGCPQHRTEFVHHH